MFIFLLKLNKDLNELIKGFEIIQKVFSFILDKNLILGIKIDLKKNNESDTSLSLPRNQPKSQKPNDSQSNNSFKLIKERLIDHLTKIAFNVFLKFLMSKTRKALLLTKNILQSLIGSNQKPIKTLEDKDLRAVIPNNIEKYSFEEKTIPELVFFGSLVDIMPKILNLVRLIKEEESEVDVMEEAEEVEFCQSSSVEDDEGSNEEKSRKK
ncbi:hypothetical protein BpHYR1_032316 [Brachionus plicatilis]|uniref:Uncharacterized protein n=1 Tax=Brachionus plicatilis TaxID=10195 RepID=A0A3M7T475_BRAPC|nr:hypothetical protein BpHYR1_032316 [Brachionus plicatilis]